MTRRARPQPLDLTAVNNINNMNPNCLSTPVATTANTRSPYFLSNLYNCLSAGLPGHLALAAAHSPALTPALNPLYAAFASQAASPAGKKLPSLMDDKYLLAYFVALQQQQNDLKLILAAAAASSAQL